MENTNKYDENIARFYDVIYNRYRRSDHTYYLNKAQECKGKVLELGVGTGRLFLDALNKGVDIYGIDNSKHMIDSLANGLKMENSHRITEGDALSFHFKNGFDMIIAPFRFISHFEDQESQLNLLRTIKSNLKPGGQFLFDFYVPNARILQAEIKKEVDFEGEWLKGEIFRRYKSVTSDFIKQINHVSFEYEWFEKGKIQSAKYSFKFRFFHLTEIKLLLKLAGLELLKASGGYKGMDPNMESTDYVLETRSAQN